MLRERKGGCPWCSPPVATATTDGARPWAARSYVAADRLLGARPWPLIFSARGPLISRRPVRSEEHTSELKSLMRKSYAVSCLKQSNTKQTQQTYINKPSHC